VYITALRYITFRLCFSEGKFVGVGEHGFRWVRFM